jgi:Arc/MetJ-type ribon-helix-helix transcriptional regulator
MKNITIYMPQHDLDRIQKCVDNEEFSDRSDAIRYMVKIFLDIKDLGPLFLQLTEIIEKMDGNGGIDLGKMVETVIEQARYAQADNKTASSYPRADNKTSK